MLSNWLRGGFEMNRHGEWRLKPQVADTLQRDVQAIMVQTGWNRSLSRSAEKSTMMGTTWNLELGRDAGAPESPSARSSKANSMPSRRGIGASAGIGANSSDMGSTASTATASIDIVNYDVRNAIANAERVAAKSPSPERMFSEALSRQVLGDKGLRNKYLENADSGRGTWDLSAPITSTEQSKILDTGRFTTDRDHSSEDGDPAYKVRKDQ